MKRKFAGIVCLILTVSILAGCGVLTDRRNYNFNKDGIPITDSDGKEVVVEVINNKNKTAEVYFDATDGMREIIADGIVQGIVQDSVDAITKTWNDVTSSLYTVDADSIDPQSSVSIINNLSAITYAGTSNDTLIRAVEHEPNKSNEKVIDPRIKIIVTDLRSQLQDYQTLAATLAKDLMEENKSFAVISVKTQKPFFIFAIGALNDLSKYLNEFYAMPNIVMFNPNMNWNTADQERNINCKIYAQNGGIEGVDFDNIQIREQGTYLSGGDGDVPPPPPEGEVLGGSNEAPPQGAPGGQPPQGNPGAPGGMSGNSMFKEDLTGSFTILRPDYAPEYLKTDIEGTANFCPEDYPNAVIPISRTVDVEVPEGVNEEDLKIDNIHYLGFKSLLWSGSDYLEQIDGKVSGKIKFTIPFVSIDQIQLTDLQFESSTEYYDANKSDGEFYDSDRKVKNNIEVAFANNTGPTDSVWRIDNQDKTVMVNIYVTDLLELPYATKLDITIGATDPGKMPVWAQSWSQMAEFKNLQNFISLLNDYNTKDNKYEETVTVYVMAGDKELDGEISCEPFMVPGMSYGKSEGDIIPGGEQ